jgi:hypothetical protein
MGIEEKFNRTIEEWKEHCEKVKYSSNGSDYVKCAAYTRILNMGKEVLPLIRKLYDHPNPDINLNSIKFHGLTRALNTITLHEFRIPVEISGRVDEIIEYTKKWLDENMHRYLKGD